MTVLSAYMLVYYMHAWCCWTQEGAAGSLGTETTDGCEPPCGGRAPNPGLQEHQVHLTTESSLQPPTHPLIF